MSPFPLLRLAVMACCLSCLAVAVSSAQDPASKSTRSLNREATPQSADGAAVLERISPFLVGDRAPDVDLTDTDGARFHLDDARRAGPWLLVFARTPEDLVGALAASADLAGLGIGVVGIAPFRREMGAARAGALRLLPDHASHFARVYGMYDPVTSNPRAGTILVGQDGRMLLILAGDSPARADLVRMAKDALHPPRKTAADTRAG